MGKTIMLTSIVCSLFFSSCIQFLYPLTHRENQIVFKTELLGKWKEQDGTEYLINRFEGTQYSVVMIDNSKGQKKFSDSNYFIMTMVNLNGNYYLDCYPDVQQTSFYRLGEQAANYLLPVHYILRLLSISQTSIEIASMNAGEITKLIDQKKFIVSYDSINNNALFLSKPEELQRKLIELEKFPLAYDREILKRF